jgi:hypothetical protein
LVLDYQNREFLHSAHPLEIETGRYSKPCIPKESRICFFCKTVGENELHFIYSLDSPVYKELRKMSYPLNICNLNDTCRRKIIVKCSVIQKMLLILEGYVNFYMNVYNVYLYINKFSSVHTMYYTRYETYKHI